MPPELRRLLSLFLDDIATESAAMGAGYKGVSDWQQAMAQNLLTYGYASYMDGAGTRAMTPQQQALVNRLIGEQLDYLNRFADDLEAKRGWENKDASRAALYAGSIKPIFWRGRTKGYDLPAYPTEGSPCIVNCGCSWDMQELDPEELDADFYWRLGATEHCAVCLERAQKWAPLRFRGGEML
jgi:hypothetical protein